MKIALFKLLAGMAIYGAIVAFARSYAGAAGMLLTFPALNGFALALAPPEKLPKTSRIMLLLPIVNGVLCAGYMFTFEHITGEDWAGWLLLGAAIVWLLIAYFWGQTDGVPDRHRTATGIALTLTMLGIATTVLILRKSDSANPNFLHVELFDYLYQSRWRIVLFAACLTGIIALTDFLIPRGWIKDRHAAAWLGTLGAFPVVPFFGMLTIASNETSSLASRIESFRHMDATVWVGPVIAIWYIYFLSRYLRGRVGQAKEMNWLWKFGLAGAGWIICLMVIASVTFVFG